MALNNRVVVIVGATGALGPAIAKAFVRESATVVLVGTARDALDKLRTEVNVRNTPVMVQPIESYDAAEMEAVAGAVTGRFGHADVLVHLPGSFRGGTFSETSLEDWEELLDVNLYSAMHTIKAFLPAMTANGWGRIVTISSGVTQAPQANVAAYVTAKAALEAMTLSVAQEVKDKGVTANVVLIRSLDIPSERARQPDKKMGWVKPEQVAATLVFLSSDEAAAITGARIPVFGGNS